ncbi:MAG: 6,7-dimethyl-8-ribityllumazine synthase [Thermaerobacter sp.]|nr:6,7-dimethyl-8-ribityllumazine synthase [Thermaerobacter sp.]
MPTFHGEWILRDQNWRIAVIVSRFNQHISEALLRGALDTLARLGMSVEAITTIWVPGAFEIPGTARRALPLYDGIMTLGAVIRGETPHFDYVASAVASGVAELSRTGEKPVIFGVLTCNTMEEAQARAGGKAGNKGSDAALALIEMLSLYQKLSGA